MAQRGSLAFFERTKRSQASVSMANEDGCMEISPQSSAAIHSNSAVSLLALHLFRSLHGIVR